jgi:hypothetical protein
MRINIVDFQCKAPHEIFKLLVCGQAEILKVSFFLVFYFKIRFKFHLLAAVSNESTLMVPKLLDNPLLI